MVTQHDFLTDEFQRSNIRLNDDLKITPHVDRDRTWFHIEVPSRCQFFRIGYREYVFISLLDGRTSLAGALAETARTLADQSLTESEADEVVHWLLENGLATTEGVGGDVKSQAPGKKPSWLSKINPFWAKIPLGKPDAALDAALPYVAWMLHPVAVAAALLTMLIACFTAWNDSERFTASFNILSADTWLWLLVAWVVLKVIHEMAHGITCRHFGGAVRETGIIFILMAPMAYVDVTSSSGFASRWQRIAVASAGMIAELFVASLCVFAWYWTDSKVAQQALANTVIMASLTTILFNANPLMRFDGYFILSDLVGVPNLYASGSKVLQAQLTWLFYGQSSNDFRDDTRHRTFITVYGWLSSMWKILISVSLTIGASVLFGGLGILLAMVGCFMYFIKPIFKAAGTFARRWRSRPHTAVRAVLVGSVVVALATASWFWVPNPFSVRSPCLVDFEDRSHVRADAPGFVAEIFVEDGQSVAAGDRLMRLENQELRATVKRLTAQLALQETKERIAINANDAAQAQIAARNQMATREILDENLWQLEQMLVRAPVDGRVAARELQQKQGRFVEKGDSIVRIGDERRKEIIISLSMDHVESTRDLVGQQVPVEIGSRRKLHATITRVDPIASTSLIDKRFSATHGGPVAVKQAQSEQDQQGDESEKFEFTDARVKVIASLDATAASQLKAGEAGYAVLQSSSLSLGQYIVRSISDWLEQQVSKASLQQ